MTRKLLKYISFGLLGLIILILMIATVVEKLSGSDLAGEYIYGAAWMVGLWGVMMLAATIYIMQKRLYRMIATFGIHLSFLLILIGAFVTHCWGIQGRLHLREDDGAVGEFALNEQQKQPLPFSLQLERFELLYYQGTFAPMDYVSHIVVDDDGELHKGTISMNNIFKYRGFRFYQSGYDKDGKGTTLSVSYDPYGIGITYTGYLCLLISMLAFFFQRGSAFKALLHHPSLRKGLMAIIALFSIHTISATPKALPQSVAERFCDLHIYYNDRICPLQTLAIDFTTKLYGKSSYNGLSAEQVLTGWFFYYDDWKHYPMIKIKGGSVQRQLGLDGKYARLTDFTDREGYKLDAMLRSANIEDRRNAESANEKFNLVSMLCTGSLLKIYPYRDGQSDNAIWYSLSDKLPGSLPYDQWLFIGNSLNLVAEQLVKRDWDEAIRLLDKIRQYQVREVADDAPTEWLFRAEKLYNNTNINRPLAMSAVSIGIVLFLLFTLLKERSSLLWKVIRRTLYALLCGVLIYLSIHIILRWFISGHVPLSNGFETMQFMAWCSVVVSLCAAGRYRMALPFGFLLCGLTMLVAMMGEATPKITQLMPVLQSPLLSIHVVVIMLAYTLLAFMMLNSITAIVLHLSRRTNSSYEVEKLYILNRILLYPAVFLLAIGIFIGAVWANVSWGRYWGWDPKEVWALITMLIYAAALHTQSLQSFKHHITFHIFCVIAFMSVIITYFGVNFILGGMHAYA